MFVIGAKKKSKAKVSSQLETDRSINTPQPPEVAPSKEPEEEEDHYARFEAEQQRQEDIWHANRTAKRPRIDDLSTNTSPAVPSVPVVDTREQIDDLSTDTSSVVPSVPVVDTRELRNTELTAKLQSKTEECEQLRSELKELREVNGVIEKAQHTLQEQFCKVTCVLFM